MSDTPETSAEWRRLQWRDGGYSSRVTYGDLAHGMSAFSKKLERERNQAMAKEQDATELCKRMIALAEKLEAERNAAIAERDELLASLKTIEFFVMDDYFPNCATPQYKAAVEKMQSILEKLKETKINNV